MVYNTFCSQVIIMKKQEKLIKDIIDKLRPFLINDGGNIEYKKKVVVRRKRIRETSLGFKTLEYKLPIWIEESLKKIKNK